MDSRAFVEKLKQYAGDGAVQIAMERLVNPSEVPPMEMIADQVRQASSNWIRAAAIDQQRKSERFQRMSASDQAVLREVLEESIGFALFSVMNFFDGVGGDSEGVLEIVEVIDEQRRTLNPDNTEMLHHLLSAVYADDREAGR